MALYICVVLHVQIIRVQSVHSGVYIDNICFRMSVYVIWFWVLGNLSRADWEGSLSEKLKQGQIILKHKYTETEALSHTLQKCAVWFCFYFHLLCDTILLSLSFFFHHLLCLLYSLILSCGVWLPVPVPSLWLTGLDDVMAIMRMCP